MFAPVCRPTNVSIHAPVKGATRTAKKKMAMMPVSIHAPVKGATPARTNL